MPAKAVVSVEGNLRNYGLTSSEIAEERELLDANAMSEMLYTRFEAEVDELAQRGIELPPPTDVNGRPIEDFNQHMYKAASANRDGAAGIPRQNGSRPISASEHAISSLMDVRDDMLRQYASVSRDPVLGASTAMAIQKIESQIISMGGDVERFNPSQYQSGLKPVVEKAVDQMEVAKKIVENTKQSYTLNPINSIYAGKSKSGKTGVCIKIATASGAIVQGTVIPKTVFSGDEVIDFVPDSGKGRMTVKAAVRGKWEDVSSDYNIAWAVEKQA